MLETHIEHDPAGNVSLSTPLARSNQNRGPENVGQGRRRWAPAVKPELRLQLLAG